MRTVEPHGTPGQHLVLGLGRLVYPNGRHAAVGALVKDRSKSQPPIGRPEWLVGRVVQSGYPKLVISCRGCDRCGRWWLATCFAQQQQQGYRSERDQHHQLEIIDIGDHCGLPRHLGVRREVGNFVTTDGLAELRRLQADHPGRFAQFKPDKKRGNLVLGGRRQR